MTGGQGDKTRQSEGWHSAVAGPPQQPISILYVGDEWTDDIVSAIDAGSENLSITTVTTSETARTALNSECFDCIVVEYVFPEQHGTEFISEVNGFLFEGPTTLLASAKTEPSPGAVVDANITAYFRAEQLSAGYTELRDRIETLVRQNRLQKRERLETAFDIADIGVWEYNTETGKIWLDETAGTIHELSGERWLTLDELISLYTQETQATATEEFHRVTQQGSSVDEILQLETEGRQWVRVRGQRVPSDDSCIRVRGYCQDITHLKQREEHFKVLHSAGQELMQATSRDDVAEITIEAAKNILGYARAVIRLVDENETVLRVYATTKENVEAAGQRPDYHVGEDVPAARSYRRNESEVFDDLAGTQDEYERGTLRSGLYVPIGDHGVFSCGDPKTNAYDRTDSQIMRILTKLAAAALTRVESDRILRQKKDQLEQFTGIVAHDLRNPLNTVVSRLELARREPGAGHFEKIEDGLTRMEAMIDDLLTLSRAGKAIEDVTAVSLKSGAVEAWQHVNAESAQLTIEESVNINADRERLLHILENLFRNAIDHNEPPVTITVGQIEDTTSDISSTTGFFVEDDGGGIPTDQREEVFDHGHTTSSDGTGFGLSIVRRVAEAHNWDVKLTEGDDGGVRFEFTNVEIAWGWASR
ncbi:ATP-binding protein [Halovenus rubra]|uniref:ATP-binding protein n=2 Tax=Halovenus rubra TaxID=869890 RepID=A0ACC7DXE6_9EURY|nr:ATP-binding protein [Halovenus rubra]